MKKTLSALGIFLLCTGISTTSFAVTTDNDTGGLLTITATVANIPDLTFESSPNVSISVITTATDYAVQTTNVLTDTTNGMEYGTLSSDTGYSQRVKITAENTEVPAPTSATQLSGSKWVAIGGATTGS